MIMSAMLPVYNPATGAEVGRIPDSTPADVDAAVGRAKSVFSSWESVAASARSVILVRAAGIIRSRADTLAALLSAGQGKPIREARDEVQGAAHV
ncbi:MAG TPA: aldehyde dehydrogenase family protein, partial [Methanocorpusculum sp.]|nr:aldehyde dehydrogenase family protein [Methanocorpusculum sp.]